MCRPSAIRNYKSGGPIELADYEASKQVIAEMLATGQSVILMCACKDLTTCHRLTVAEHLATTRGEGYMVDSVMRFPPFQSSLLAWFNSHQDQA
jgi:hypothetical protein